MPVRSSSAVSQISSNKIRGQSRDLLHQTMEIIMRKAVVYFLLLLAGSIANASVDTEFLQGLGDTRYHRVESDGIGRSFHIYVMLPDGYNETADIQYPTIYLLDGGVLFPLLSVYSRYLTFGEEMPNAIIVGISYGSDTFDGGNYRSTDYTAKSSEREYWGGAGQFQQFLRDELLPFIEAKYAARSDRRVIFGQSIAGQFVLYTAQTDPNLFWGHVASNPALHRNLPFFLEMHAESVSGNKRSKLFVASGTNDDPRFRGPALQWIEYWSGNDDSPWQLRTMNLDGHSHMSAPPASFRQGMRWLFSID